MLRRTLNPSLWQQVPRDHRQSRAAFRRRQLVTVLVVLIGAVVLGLSLRIDPGNALFYPATLGLAAVWVVGAFASGPLHLGRIDVGEVLRRPIVQPILLGLVLAGFFVVGGLLVHKIGPLDPLDRQVGRILAHADQGTGGLTLLVTVVNGVAEELFFRGAFYTAAAERPILISTAAYTLATAASRNPALTVAGVVMGTLFGMQRRASGGIQAPVLTHVTWAMLMLRFLPPLFEGSIRREEILA